MQNLLVSAMLYFNLINTINQFNHLIKLININCYLFNSNQ
nr:MAG TPA: hypothetical protein [Caudoviricetes sp.]